MQFVFKNPHSFVTVQAPDSKGVMRRWSLEWSGTAQLANQGVTRESLKPGDEVIVVGNPSRVTGEFKALMVSLKRPLDGFTWGGRGGEDGRLRPSCVLGSAMRPWFVLAVGVPARVDGGAGANRRAAEGRRSHRERRPQST